MQDLPPAPVLGEQLARWVAAGLIDAGQAERIAVAEAQQAAVAQAQQTAVTGAARADAGVAQTVVTGAERAGAGVAPGRAAGRTPLTVEALGYVGGVLAIVAGFVSVHMLWPDVPVGAQLAFAAVAAVALGGAASVMTVGGEPAFARLRSVLWLMSTVSVTVFMGVLSDQVWHLSGVSGLLVTAAVTAVCGVVAWWRTHAPLQHLAAFAAIAATVGAGIARFAPGLHEWGPGLGVWVLSAAWGAAAYRGYLRPQHAGYLAAGVGLVVGAMLTMQEAAGNVLAPLTLIGLLMAGVALRWVWLVALGAVGIILIVPQTLDRYLPQSVGGPVAVFVVGLALVGLALRLAKGRRPRTRQPPAG